MLEHYSVLSISGLVPYKVLWHSLADDRSSKVFDALGFSVLAVLFKRGAVPLILSMCPPLSKTTPIVLPFLVDFQ